jgi:pilus assembly protein FimV
MNNRFQLSFINAGMKIAVAAILLAFSSAAWSLGLGDVTVESYLNQPLKARIDLISSEDDDLKTLSAKLASAEDYKLIGASRAAISVPLRFTVEDLEGDAYVAVSSKLPVQDPIIRLMVEVQWAKGRILREYTLFLDPPTYAAPAPAPAAVQREDSRRPSRPGARQPESGEYGPVQSGETLWKIAKDWSEGSDMDVNKVMIAIQRENPQAFINNNINLLKQGAILRMPEAGDVNAISSSRANNEVSEQSAEFRRRSAMTSASTPLLTDQAISRPSEEPVEEPEAPPDRLELVPPSERLADDNGSTQDQSRDEANAAPGSDEDVAVLREELARTEEELFNQQQQNEYLQDRIRELEEQAGADDSLAVDDAGLAGMEDRLRDERLAEETETPAPEPEKAVPSVTTRGQAVQEKPWYASMTLWIIVLVVLAAAAAGWLLSRRGSEETHVTDLGARDEPVPAPVEEAEKTAVMDVDDAGEGEAVDDAAVVSEEPTVVVKHDEDAEVLDEDSADPEIKLDLARAYIAMGDKEAARSILEEVIAHGSEEQQADAQAMMDKL